MTGCYRLIFVCHSFLVGTMSWCWSITGNIWAERCKGRKSKRNLQDASIFEHMVATPLSRMGTHGELTGCFSFRHMVVTPQPNNNTWGSAGCFRHWIHGDDTSAKKGNILGSAPCFHLWIQGGYTSAMMKQ